MKQLAALAQQKQLQTPADISPRKTHGKRQERTQAGPHPLPSPAATGSTPTSKRCQRDCMEMENAMRSAKGAPRHAHAALPGMPAYFQSSAAKGSQSFHCCYNRSAGGIFPMSQEWIFKLNAPANASFPKQAPMGWTRSAPRGPPLLLPPSRLGEGGLPHTRCRMLFEKHGQFPAIPGLHSPV